MKVGSITQDQLKVGNESLLTRRGSALLETAAEAMHSITHAERTLVHRNLPKCLLSMLQVWADN